ncbi:MAG: hypothetical protein Q8L55_00670 [Phycisphaerales bacterium]|nr:hypothetical protein [Phycisphaerales bacterium]
MHQRIFEHEEPKQARTGWYRPRMEAPIIAKVLIPAEFGARFYDYGGVFEGVVWSGIIEYLPFPPHSIWNWHSVIADRYAMTGQNSSVGRVGPGGDIWGANLSLRVARDMCGELHTSSVSQGANFGGLSLGIAIGCRLGDAGNWPYPSFANGVEDPLYAASVEPTPRGRAQIGPTEFEADVAPK